MCFLEQLEKLKKSSLIGWAEEEFHWNCSSKTFLFLFNWSSISESNFDSKIYFCCKRLWGITFLRKFKLRKNFCKSFRVFLNEKSQFLPISGCFPNPIIDCAIETSALKIASLFCIFKQNYLFGELPYLHKKEQQLHFLPQSQEQYVCELIRFLHTADPSLDLNSVAHLETLCLATFRSSGSVGV